MAAKRDDQQLPQGWDDIPDPLLGSGAPSSSPMKPPVEKAPTRGQVRLQRGALLGAALFWPAAVFFYYEGSWRGHGIDFVAAQFAVWSACLAFAAWVALSAGTRGVGRPVPWLRFAAVGAPLAFMVLALLWLPPNGKSFGAVGPAGMLEGCFQIGLTVAAPMALLAVLAMRRAFPTGAAWRGAALGAACGLGGVVVLVHLCGSPYGGHIALAHGMPLVIATILGALGGRRIGRS
ncbi:MAG: NrsF family protein [Polyangiaceae bacterium]